MILEEAIVAVQQSNISHRRIVSSDHKTVAEISSLFKVSLNEAQYKFSLKMKILSGIFFSRLVGIGKDL